MCQLGKILSTFFTTKKYIAISSGKSLSQNLGPTFGGV